MTSIANILSSSIKVSISASIARELARALRYRLFIAQGLLGAVPQVQSCVDNFVELPSEGRYGKSLTPCRSKHGCFLCTPQELAKERTSIGYLLWRWSDDSEVLVLTLNLNYPIEVGLEGRYKLLMDTWKALMQDSRIQRLRTSSNLKYVRVLEEVLSKGRWFPHLHVLIRVDSMEEYELDLLSDTLRHIWVKKAVKNGCIGTIGAVQHVERFKKGTHKELASYLTKNGEVDLFQDSATIDLLTENLTPFQTFQYGIANQSRRALELWEEFEVAVQGKHRVTYSAGARVDLSSLKDGQRLGRQIGTQKSSLIHARNRALL